MELNNFLYFTLGKILRKSHNPDFSDFMKRETFDFSPAYAKESVTINGGDHLNEARSSGGVLLFLHFGSFFLSGGAITHQLKLSFNLIASRHNLQFLPKIEAKFWKGVHKRSSKLYNNNLIYSDSGARNIVKYLDANILLGIAVDVQEKGNFHRTHPFDFLGNKLYFQTSAERLAKLSNKKLFSMIIVHDKEKNSHELRISPPMTPGAPFVATQSALAFMEPFVASNPNQMFHNLQRLFAKPHVASN